MTHYIIGTSQVARPKTGGAAPSNDVSGYAVVGRSQIARPCPDGPEMPANDPSGYAVHGHAVWRAPCAEAGCGHCATNGLYDDFERTVAEGWGTSTPTLQTYENYDIGGGYFSVSDGAGNVNIYGSDVNVVKVEMPEFCGWTRNTGFVMRFDFQFGSVTPRSYIRLHTIVSSPFWYVQVKPLNDSTGQLEIDSDPGFNSADKTDWVADTWYSLKVEYDPGSFMGLKVWPRADAEPADWNISLLGSDVAGPLSGGMQWEFSGGGVEYVFAIDNLSFCCDMSPGNTCGWQGPGS